MLPTFSIFTFTEEECNEDGFENSCHELENNADIPSIKPSHVGGEIKTTHENSINLSETQLRHQAGRNSLTEFFHHPLKTVFGGNQMCALFI